MPFQSTIANPGTNFSFTGKASRGVSAERSYSFVSLPASIVEKNILTTPHTNKSQSINVSCTNTPDGTVLYWSILNQTTSNEDFVTVNGSFVSTNESGVFNITINADAALEGSELFQIEIRQFSVNGPVVLTSALITIDDNSQPPTYIFDSTNPTSLDEGVWGSTFSGQVKYFKILTTDVSSGYLYYTMTSTTANVTVAATSDISYYTSEPYPGSGILKDGRVYIYAYGGTLYPQGYGTIAIWARNDNLTEGTETFQIQIRTGSTTGPIVATSPEISISDTSQYFGPATGNFQYQVIGGGAGGPNTLPGGGGGGGGFASGSMAWSVGTDAARITWYINVGAGGAPRISGGDTYIRSQYAGNPWMEFFGRGGGRGASNNSAASWGGGGGGGSGTGTSSASNYGANQWDNSTGTQIVTISATNRQAGTGGQSPYARTSGGGGGAGPGNGTAGGSTLSGKGGSGKLNWLGTLCGQGGGGVNLTGAQATRFNNSTDTNGANPGEAGLYQGSGANGVAIIRYPDTKAPVVSISGTYETYVTGGYRYYIWTSGAGTFRVSN